MNIRKNIDYSTMFDSMRVAMSADMFQMKLYCELGRLICQRTEKGAAVAAAEYLQQNYPDVPGLSPRNLRRMRDFYRMYEGTPELLDLAMQIGWTQNVVILESALNMEKRHWYLCAVRQLGLSKAELQRKIEVQAHLQVYLDESKDKCYTKFEAGRVEKSSEEFPSKIKVFYEIGRQLHHGNRHAGFSPRPIPNVLSLPRLLRKTGPPTFSSKGRKFYVYVYPQGACINRRYSSFGILA